MMIEQYGCTVVSVIAPNLCKFINIHLRIPHKIQVQMISHPSRYTLSLLLRPSDGSDVVFLGRHGAFFLGGGSHG